MASETAGGESLTVSLPSELDEWLDQRADALGVDREAVLVQLLAAYRVAADVEDETAVDALDRRLAEEKETVTDAVARALESDEVDLAAHLDLEGRIESELEDVQREVDDLQSQVSEQIDEVKRRVVQVKQEVDEKAPEDHTHENLERLPEIAQRLDSLRSTVGELQTVLEEGEFAHRLDTLEENTSDIRSRLNTLASAVVALRAQVSGGPNTRQETLTDIRQRAAAEGIETATCDNCGKSVSVGLLAEPVCPHCGSDFASVEPSTQFLFGSATLKTDRPQLEEGSDE